MSGDAAQGLKDMYRVASPINIMIKENKHNKIHDGNPNSIITELMSASPPPPLPTPRQCVLHSSIVIPSVKYRNMATHTCKFNATVKKTTLLTSQYFQRCVKGSLVLIPSMKRDYNVSMNHSSNGLFRCSLAEHHLKQCNY